MDDNILLTLLSLTDQVNIAQHNDIVYKDQCFYSFDTADSLHGIFVSLHSFYCYGLQFVKYYFEKTGYRLFLHIKRNKIDDLGQFPNPSVDESVKPTKLGLGVEGGFPATNDCLRNCEEFSLVVLPEFYYIPLSSSIPSQIYESLMSIIDRSNDLPFTQFETWEQTLFVSKHSHDLIQLNCRDKILPSGWKCSKCDMTRNLWLNLTDGAILCGRRQFDGSGGNDHALEHYTSTRYPLSVKLGTITPNGADVFSYDEDEMVIDSLLSQHLSHFGITITSMHKTEKSMDELQIDLNIQVGEASIIQESNSILKPIHGSGYTGLNNLGNSCYLNSVFQVILSIPQFYDYFYKKVDFISLFAPNVVIFDVIFQLKKLARGIFHREYSLNSSKHIPVDFNTSESDIPLVPTVLSDSQYAPISPLHLRIAIGKGHREFSSTKQQDAQEFLLYLLNTIDKCLLSSKINPCDIFRFTVEDRLECLQSHQFQYSSRIESILSLVIPNSFGPLETEIPGKSNYVDDIGNCEVLDNSNVQKRKIFRVSIKECLQNFLSPHIISDFLSPVSSIHGSASKTSAIKTFPEYLFIHLEKFSIGEDWVPQKLDVEISGTDELLDLEFLRSSKSESNEILMSCGGESINTELLEKLLEIGCNEQLSRQALTRFDNDFESALSWVLDPDSSVLLEHKLDQPEQSKIDSLMVFGFDHAQSLFALNKTGHNVERAIDYLFSHSHDISSLIKSDSMTTIDIMDGNAQYSLVSIISHIGTSTMCGHYVAHIFKDGRWVLFNDENVVESQNPPFTLGYLYLYKRFIL